MCDFVDSTHLKCVTELIKMYLPRRDPRVAPSCLQERPNVTGIKEVNTQTQHTHTPTHTFPTCNLVPAVSLRFV